LAVASSASYAGHDTRAGPTRPRPEPHTNAARRVPRCMRLHDYVASANCYKVRLLLAQLGRDYERVPVDIFDSGTLTDDFARLNPLRSTPVLELDDGRVLLESNAILWYLAHGTDFLPVDPFEQAEVARWLIYEQSDVMLNIGGLRFRLVTGRWRPYDEPAAAR